MRPQDPQIPTTLMVNCLSYSAAVASEGQMNEGTHVAEIMQANIFAVHELLLVNELRL